MLVVAVAALPFHRWILAPVVQALREAGAEVEEVVHVPRYGTDWLSNHPEGLVARRLQTGPMDLILCCEYPYQLLRKWSGGVSVVTLRHSLSSRRNTWEQEQAQANGIVTWSAMDERLLTGRAKAESSRFIPTGCTFVEPLAAFPRSPCGILWAPSHNAPLSCRPWVTHALSKMVQDGVPVRVRVHGATFIKEPGLRVEWARLGFDVLDSEEAPYRALTEAGVLVVDVSGVTFLGSHVPGLPIVQVTAPISAVLQSPQYDPDGPEWRYREAIGPCVRDEQALISALRTAMDGEPDIWAPSRKAVCVALTGGLESCQGASARAAREIIRRFGR